MIYGFIAAAGWGMSTIAAAKAARRAGTYIAILLSQVLGAAALTATAVAARAPVMSLGAVTLAGLALAGLLQLAGWATYYRALEAGPVGMVSTVAASYAGITAVLAVTVAREQIGSVGGGGVALAVAGVTIAAASSGEPAASGAGGQAPAGRARHRAARRRCGGIPLAITSAATYGTGAFLLGRYSPNAGWLASSLVAYATSVAALTVALPFTCRVRALWRSTTALGWAAAAGLAEAAALLAFARGGQQGEMAVTAAVSSLYPLIPLAAGLLLFREHLTRRQVLGAGCIISGLVLIGLA